VRVWHAFAIHGDVPTGRTYAWNVAAVLFAAGDLYVAHRLGVLGWILAALAAMVTATGVALALISQRHSRDVVPSRVPDEVAGEHDRAAAASVASLREAA
jgi:hypothetical protein